MLKGTVPNWLRVWLTWFAVSLAVYAVGGLLSGWRHERLPARALEALVSGGVFAWLMSVGDRLKAPPP